MLGWLIRPFFYESVYSIHKNGVMIYDLDSSSSRISEKKIHLV